eukprot:3196910-Prorocentrum_lima.AAC.1
MGWSGIAGGNCGPCAGCAASAPPRIGRCLGSGRDMGASSGSCRARPSACGSTLSCPVGSVGQ